MLDPHNTQNTCLLTFHIFNQTRYLMTYDSKNYSGSFPEVVATFFCSPDLGCQNVCASFYLFFEPLIYAFELGQHQFEINAVKLSGCKRKNI